MPVEVKVVKTKKGTMEIGRKFPDGDNWFNGLTVNVKNTSGKTIIYLGGGFLFPRPKDEVVKQSAPPRYQRFMYGRHPLAPEGPAQTTQPISIKPGETFSVTISESDYISINKRLNELGYTSSIKEINFNIEEIYFADGTAWRAGSWYQRDPANPKNYKRVEKLLSGAQVRFKGIAENRVPFVKASLTKAEPAQL